MEESPRTPHLTRRGFTKILVTAGAVGAAASMAGCVAENSRKNSSTSTSAKSTSSNTSTSFNPSAWNYDADNDIYYQLGVQYCAKPQATTYESMGIYVPGAFFDAKKNSDGTYTCVPNDANSVGGFTASTAPIVMPINTAGYSAQAAPTSYSANGITGYTAAGFVYVFAGCRGRRLSDDAPGGAPWGVTDLKAAVRTLRANASNLAGNTERIFSFGHSGGGAQSAVLAATGDAAGYMPYLEAIGAPTKDVDGKTLSDAIYGAMCWCPITCLDQADAAYEWNMGQFATSGTRADGTFTKQLSDDLAISYADYINNAGFTADGKELTLSSGGAGIYTNGTYYDYVVGVIEESLNNFLDDTTFPYTPSSGMKADMGASGGSHGGPSSGSGEKPSGEPPSGGSGGASGGGSSAASSTSYETAADYIAHLNEGTTWVRYNEATNSATITGLAGFVGACKSPSKSVGAFDDLSRGQAENGVFGDDSNNALHFDATMAQLLADNTSDYAVLSDWKDSYPDDYANDLEYTNGLGSTIAERANLYNPLYYLLPSYKGAGTSTPAKHWRIRTGITQGDTPLTTEINLALAAQVADGVEDVDFATVWGQGHTTAERTGSSTANFIAWVQECCK